MSMRHVFKCDVCGEERQSSGELQDEPCVGVVYTNTPPGTAGRTNLGGEDAHVCGNRCAVRFIRLTADRIEAIK